LQESPGVFSVDFFISPVMHTYVFDKLNMLITFCELRSPATGLPFV